ncbi:MAG: hypothetical protein H8F28_13120 [Fibrella sp.]|nr:hypothetical protein [Armatimonadota bacterium]
MFSLNLSQPERATITVALMYALCAPALAQGETRPPTASVATSNEKRSVFALLRHDPKRQGPLVFISHDQFPVEYGVKDEASIKQAIGGKTPAQFAELMKRRILTVGDIVTFIPPTMKVIVKNPGKADPFAGLRFEQRFVLVLGALTPEQWKQAGSANGIGLSDLTDKQRSLFAGMWRSEALTVQNVRTKSDSDIPVAVETTSVPVSGVRFRVSRRVALQLRPVGQEHTYGYTPGTDADDEKGELQTDGTYIRQLLQMPDDSQDAERADTASAFGVPVMVTVPNGLKSGQLALDTPALNVGMRLDGSRKTVGELLAAVSAATRFRLVADRRIASLPVGYKLTPGGQIVSTGDVLKVLCRSVTGTFRRLDGPGGATVYLLTDDIEGIGTRFARLDRWAEKPYEKLREVYQNAINDCAENEPIDSLGFAPDSPFTLPTDQLKTINDSYASQGLRNTPPVPVSQLSPALQEEFRKGVESWRKWQANVTMRTDTVSLDTDFHCDWILPGGRAFPATVVNRDLSFSFLRQIAVPKSKRVASRDTRIYKHPSPTPFPPALKRRVLTTPLPETESDIQKLLALLRRKGFTETWLRVEDSNITSRDRLQQAVFLGAKSGVRVGVVIPWLLKTESGAKSAPDVNILGENGTAIMEAEVNSIADKNMAEKQRAYYSDRNAGWVVAETQDIHDVVRHASPFLTLANLSAVAFTNPAAPGYTSHDENGDDGFGIGDRMGYNKQTRFRCVQDKGFDPVDVAASTHHLGVSVELPFFRQYEVVKPLAEFRRSQNRAHLARVYAAIRTAFPRTTLYMDNPENRLFEYYGRWEKPDGFPADPAEYVSSANQLRKTAFRNGSSPVFAIRGTRSEGADAYFWNAWHDGMEEAAKGWGGFALNMPTDSLDDVMALLNKLPDDMPP